jgi:hypothetical protein
MSNADMHRLWVDDITTIKGTDSMTVNVGKDLNLTGAAILSDNLAVNVTGNINKKELQDSYYSESMSLGASTSIAVSGNQATIPGTGGQPNQFPGGASTIAGSYAENESDRTVYATIGGLDSTLTSATKDVTGGDFAGSLTLDHRLFSEAGRNQVGNDLKQSIEVGKIVLPKVWASPNTAIGLAYGGAGYLYGVATGQDVKVSIGNNAIQFEGNPINPFGAQGAITLGNAINYVGSATPDSGKNLGDGYYTYAYGADSSGRLPTDSDRIILGAHESEHTYQAEILGPLFLPTYLLSGGISSNNWLENAADKVGNGAYINWKNGNENK